MNGMQITKVWYDECAHIRTEDIDWRDVYETPSAQLVEITDQEVRRRAADRWELAKYKALKGEETMQSKQLLALAVANAFEAEACKPGHEVEDEAKRYGNNKKPYRKHAARSKAKAARMARKAGRK